MLSFVASGLACIFAALCYAEFASMTPVAGSAYTYAYATLGELFAWIIGWDLILEYAVASMTVAHGWSKNFQDLLAIFGFQLPKAVSNSPFDYDPALGHFVSTGSIFDLPAVLIAGLVTWVLVIGIKESAGFNTAMVVVKVAIVLLVIGVGVFYVNPDNWTPFAPYGLTGISVFGHTLFGQTGAGGEPLGMLAGAAVIFFAYIGFDSVSTHAEEAKKPSRDVPIGIVASLVICTILYIAVSAVLTGMVPYDKINIETPVSDAFRQAGLPWMRFLVSLGAVAGITSVLLVMMLSQPRVWLAMARDGLFPPSFFGAVHEKYRTPWKATILTGVAVAIGARFPPLAHPRRPHEHRNAVRVRGGLRGRAHHAGQAPRGRAAVPGAVLARDPDPRHLHLPRPDVLAASRELVAALRLAGPRLRDLLQLRHEAQRDAEADGAGQGLATPSGRSNLSTRSRRSATPPSPFGHVSFIPAA